MVLTSLKFRYLLNHSLLLPKNVHLCWYLCHYLHQQEKIDDFCYLIHFLIDQFLKEKKILKINTRGVWGGGQLFGTWEYLFMWLLLVFYLSKYKYNSIKLCYNRSKELVKWFVKETQISNVSNTVDSQTT